MAQNTIYSVTVDFLANTARLNSAIGRAALDLRGFHSGLRGLGIDSLLASQIDKGLSKLKTIEIQALQVGKAAGMSDQLRSEIRDKAMQWAKDASISIDNMFKITIASAKAGLRSVDLEEFAQGMGKLSLMTTDMEADSLVNAIVRINAAFKLPVKEMINLGSAVDHLADANPINAAQLYNTAQRLAGVGKAAKLSAAEVLALGAAQLSTGTRPELAASALSRYLKAMNTDTGQEAVAEQIGMSEFDVKHLAIENPLELIIKHLEHIKSLPSLKEVNEDLAKMGIKATVAGGVLMNLSSKTKEIGQMAKEASDQIKSGEKLDKTHKQYESTVQAQSNRMQAEIDHLQTELAAALLPAIQGCVTGFKDLIESLREGKKGFDAVKEWSIGLKDFVGTPSKDGSATQIGNYGTYAATNALSDGIETWEKYDPVNSKLAKTVVDTAYDFFSGNWQMPSFIPGQPQQMKPPTSYWDTLKDTARNMRDQVFDGVVPSSEKAKSEALDKQIQAAKKGPIDDAITEAGKIPNKLMETLGNGLKKLGEKAQEGIDKLKESDDAIKRKRDIKEKSDNWGFGELFGWDMIPILEMLQSGKAQEAIADGKQGRRNVSFESISDRYMNVQQNIISHEDLVKENNRLQEKANDILYQILQLQERTGIDLSRLTE